MVGLEAPTPVGPSAAGPDGSREDPVCPRAVAAATISKTAQATTVMTMRRGDFPDGGHRGLLPKAIMSPSDESPTHARSQRTEVAHPGLSDIRRFSGGVEADNVASIRCLTKQGSGFGPRLPTTSVRRRISL